MDRTQQLKRGVLTFGFRCAPVSYGIICHKVYNREIHVGERVQMDVRDKRLYALDQIDWLVVKVCICLSFFMFEVDHRALTRGVQSHRLESQRNSI